MDFVATYIEQLRSRAADREREGSPLAGAYTRVAEELEELRRRYETEEPSFREAAKVSGYSEDRLRQLKKSGKWSGKWSDLPRHPRPAQRPRMTADSPRRSVVDDIIDRAPRRAGGTR